MGSKSKYAKYIVPILQKTIDDNDIDTYIEYFCGGCNIIDKINCKNKLAYDKKDTLIALLKLSSTDFDKVLKEGNRELWDKGKGYVKDGIKPDDMSLADIGAMEFLGSYCNGGFPRGYAKNTSTRNYYREAYNNLKNQAPDLKDIQFAVMDYTEVEPEAIKNTVIYLDPPYAGTKKYGYTGQTDFDYDYFWEWVRKLSKNNFVFISEQTAPDDFEVVWEKEVKRTTNKANDFQATEHLFKWKEGK